MLLNFSQVSIVYAIDGTETIKAIAGNGKSGYNGDGGLATAAEIGYPVGIVVDSEDNLYIADSNHSVVRKVSPNGIISTVAGNGTAGYSGDGGTATAAQLKEPFALALDSVGNLYIADKGSYVVRKVDSTGRISTVAGNGSYEYTTDGVLATATGIGIPSSLAVDGTGTLYIGDEVKTAVRKVDTSGIITKVTGTGINGFSGDGGPARTAVIGNPAALAVDLTGSLYIADFSNARIRKMDTNGVISTVAGSGTAGYSGDGGPATAARISYPKSLAIDAAGNLYIGDGTNARVRKVTPSGVISTVVGNGTTGYSGNGGSATSAQIYVPAALAVDAASNLYLSDWINHTVRKVGNHTVIGDCDLPWGGNLPSGQSITAYTTDSSTTCASGSETRICTNGVLSGSFKYATCSSPAAVCKLPWGGTLTSGQGVTAYSTGSSSNCNSASQTRICTNGVLSGSFTLPACTATSASCSLPWGGTLASGQSVSAYSASSSSNCAAGIETRTCTNGVLSGSFTNSSCVATNQSCPLPWGGTLASGQSITAYSASGSIICDEAVPETRVCNNGILSGSFTNPACALPEPKVPMPELSQPVPFGNQTIGTVSQPQVVLLRNLGTGVLDIQSITASNQFVVSHNCSQSLAPGADCQISVNFAPSSNGTQSGTLTVNGSGQSLTATLTGTGVMAKPVFSITADLTLKVTGKRTGKNGKPIIYTITLKNQSTQAVPNVQIQGSLSSGSRYTTRPGYCTVDGSALNCQLGVLGKKKQKVISVKVTPSVPGKLSFSAKAMGNANDPNELNNTGSVLTEIK